MVRCLSVVRDVTGFIKKQYRIAVIDIMSAIVRCVSK